MGLMKIWPNTVYNVKSGSDFLYAKGIALNGNITDPDSIIRFGTDFRADQNLNFNHFNIIYDTTVWDDTSEKFALIRDTMESLFGSADSYTFASSEATTLPQEILDPLQAVGMKGGDGLTVLLADKLSPEYLVAAMNELTKDSVYEFRNSIIVWLTSNSRDPGGPFDWSYYGLDGINDRWPNFATLVCPTYAWASYFIAGEYVLQALVDYNSTTVFIPVILPADRYEEIENIHGLDKLAINSLIRGMIYGWLNGTETVSALDIKLILVSQSGYNPDDPGSIADQLYAIWEKWGSNGIFFARGDMFGEVFYQLTEKAGYNCHCILADVYNNSMIEGRVNEELVAYLTWDTSKFFEVLRVKLTEQAETLYPYVCMLNQVRGGFGGTFDDMWLNAALSAMDVNGDVADISEAPSLDWNTPSTSVTFPDDVICNITIESTIMA